MSNLSRRHFMAAASAGVATIALQNRTARAAGANDRLRVASIGVGGRGTGLLADFHAVADQNNAEIVAVCDVWKPNREKAAATVKGWWGKDPFTTSRYQDIVSRDDIDAVIVATPDFWHMPITIAALNAGKDVYVEKPMAIKVDEANEALRVAREKKRVVQVGTQRRSDGGYKAAAKVYQTGVLGQVSRVSGFVSFNHARWAQPVDNCKPEDVDWTAYAAQLPEPSAFDPKLLREWQLFRACTNGLAGLWMTHFADVLHMITGAKYPASAVAHGGVYVWKDGRQTSDTFTALLEYPEGFLFDWSMNLGIATGGIVFNAYGTKGTLDVEKLVLNIPGAARRAPRATSSKKGTATKPAAAAPEGEKIKAEPNESHMGNWLTCVRSRQQPNADIQYGHQHAIATILAAEALYSGRKLRWDAGKQQIVAG